MKRPSKVGLILPTYGTNSSSNGWTDVLEAGRQAADISFDSLWICGDFLASNTVAGAGVNDNPARPLLALPERSSTIARVESLLRIGVPRF